jgi:hypothetical protein
MSGCIPWTAVLIDFYKKNTMIKNVTAALAVCLLLTLSCKKDNKEEQNSEQDFKTAVGKPIGTKVSRTVDGTGAQISSDDGVLTVIIPAGALATSTEISIQTIENKAPNALGNAYRLLPSGIQFQKNIQLSWKTDGPAVKGYPVNALLVARQKPSGVWEGTSSFDEASTGSILVIGGISSFAPNDWGFSTPLRLENLEGSHSLLSGQVPFLATEYTIAQAKWNQLPKPNEVAHTKLTQLLVDGTAQTEGNGSRFVKPQQSVEGISAIYYAPVALLPAINPVELKATFNTATGEPLTITHWVQVNRGDNEIDAGVEGIAAAPWAQHSYGNHLYLTITAGQLINPNMGLKVNLTIEDFDTSTPKSYSSGAKCIAELTSSSANQWVPYYNYYQEPESDGKFRTVYGDGGVTVTSIRRSAIPNSLIVSGTYNFKIYRGQSNGLPQATTLSGKFEAYGLKIKP